MIRVRKLSPNFAVFCLLTASPLFLLAGSTAQTDLKYQDRGDRYEGVRGSPVSDGVELISAVVDYKDTSYTTPPEQFKLRLYLPQQMPVYVTVREIIIRESYWLDKIRPPSGWRLGLNEFAWPTSDVINQLKALKLSELGAVAQLETAQQSPDMKLVPVVLFHSTVPHTVGGYAFAFRISRKADVTWDISKDEPKSSALQTGAITGMLGNLPRSIIWNAATAKEGWYRLGINVVYLNDGKEINQVVRFYHRPTLS